MIYQIVPCHPFLQDRSHSYNQGKQGSICFFGEHLFVFIETGCLERAFTKSEQFLCCLSHLNSNTPSLFIQRRLRHILLKAVCQLNEPPPASFPSLMCLKCLKEFGWIPEQLIHCIRNMLLESHICNSCCDLELLFSWVSVPQTSKKRTKRQSQRLPGDHSCCNELS